jgi:hypothetical protein
MKAIVWRFGLVTIGVPLPEFVITYGYEVFRVCRREADMPHNVLLPDNTLAFPCLDVP